MTRILVACEFSGIVRDAFRERGHDAVSCDLLPSERPGPHIRGDVLDVLDGGWDLLIAHPPCTYLAVSGARWFAGRHAEQEAALDFVRLLLDAPIPRIALENPVSVISSRIRKPDQIIQPWQFGHGETKATCLWLKGLPPLVPTDIVDGREARVHRMPPGPDRWRERSRTLRGKALLRPTRILGSQRAVPPPRATGDVLAAQVRIGEVVEDREARHEERPQRDDAHNHRVAVPTDCRWTNPHAQTPANTLPRRPGRNHSSLDLLTPQDRNPITSMPPPMP